MSKQTDANEEQRDGNNSVQAALARTLSRSLALYFSRPVRLFRPSKVSGWQSLQRLAKQDGASLTPQYISILVKSHGVLLLPKHFLPPIMVNGLLGVVLWTTYAKSLEVLEPYLRHHPTVTVALAGGIAGGVQALVAAPVENVRLVVEGRTVYHSWHAAWKEVFRGVQPRQSISKEENIKDMREVRQWMKDVAEMAGRGWSGWAWGLGKDVTGFAMFFSIFEVTRRVALDLRTLSKKVVKDDDKLFQKYIPPMLHAFTLVTGGVFAGLAYELVGRPWDAARRIVHLSDTQTSTFRAVEEQLRRDGILSFLRAPRQPHTVQHIGWFQNVLRTLGRVGPWGCGFLVWEAYGAGFSQPIQ